MHADDDALWVLALGEGEGEPSAAEHVRGCPACADELAGRRRVVEAARRPPPADLPLRPPARVLDAVLAEVGLPVPGPDGSSPRTPAAGDEEDARGRAGVPVLPVQADGSHDAAGRGRRAATAGRRRTAVLAAVVGVVLGLGAGAGLAGRTAGEDPGAPTAGEVRARAVLEPLDATGARGTAVLRDGDGAQVLEVDLVGAEPAPGSYQEVWLLDEPTGALVSLGALADGRGVFTVPEGAVAVAGAEQVQVDVSDEALDGRPTHSGASLARGPLLG